MRSEKRSSSRKKTSSRSKSRAKASKAAQADEQEGEQLSEEELKDALMQATKPYAEWDLLSDEIKEGLAKQGFVNPTSVQAVSIEPALAGHDLVVQAKTGTGKTASFGIPLIQTIEPNGKGPQALIQAPTRELARQVADELIGLAAFKDIKILPVYGGTSVGEQIDALEKGVDIVVGTPGRLLDHIKRKTLKTEFIKHVVLDEADEMLSMGFFLEVTSIIERCNNREQTLLFSATIPPDIEGLIRQFTHKPLRLMVSGGDRKVEGIGHVLYFANEDIPRPRNLLYLIEHECPGTTMIFCNRKTDTALVAAYLLRQGKRAEAIHGDLDQRDRERVLAKLKNNEVQFLVATDVASRGIDISGLTHVINYNFPPSSELYIHRVGRTGRQGRQGVAISLANGADAFQIMQLKRLHKIFFDTRRIPEAKEVVKIAASRHIGRMFEESLDTIFEPYLPLADGLLQDPRGRFVVAHLLKLYHDGEIKQLQETLDHTPKVEPPPAPEQTKETKPQEKQEKQDEPAEKEEKKSTRAKKPKKEDESSDDEKKSSDTPEMIKLYFKNAGSGEGYDENSLKEFVTQKANVSPDHLGKAQIERTYSYLHVTQDVSDSILSAFQEVEDEKDGISAEVAKKRPRRRRRRS